MTANADELVVETSADPRSLDAAVLMQAALDSWRDRTAWAAHEVVPIAPETLRSWSREPAPVDEHAWRRAPSTDARWLWATALLLLGVEAYVRRSPRGSAHGVRANAA